MMNNSQAENPERRVKDKVSIKGKGKNKNKSKNKVKRDDSELIQSKIFQKSILSMNQRLAKISEEKYGMIKKSYRKFKTKKSYELE